jgi:hypothetical protein
MSSPHRASTPSTRACATRYCGCGRCYSPGSLVGDWVTRRAVAAWRAIRRGVLRRPHRFEYDARGGVRLPEWVAELFGQSRGTR